MITVTVANQKGGVGKTSTAVHLASEFALQGFRTLLVDADPQANATLYLIPEEEVTRGLDAVMLKRGDEPLADISGVALTTEIPNLAVVPSRIELAAYDRESHLSVARLRNALEAVAGSFDYCFVDTPPTLGKLLSASLAACDYVLIPCQSEPHAVKGLNDLLDVVEEAREINPRIKVAGACITMFDRRTNIAAAIREKLSREFEEHTFETVIRRQVGLVECSTENRPIQLYAPKSSGAEDYRALALELLTYLGATLPTGAAAGVAASQT